MALPGAVGDREYQKFIECENNRVAVNILGNLMDAAGNTLKMTPEGELKVVDLEQRTLLSQLLVQLKIANFHNTLMTDHEITEREL